MFNIAQFRELIVKSSLNDLMLYSENLEEILIFTCAVESYGGSFLTGRGLGIYQMDVLIYNDVFQNYIKTNSKLSSLLINNFQVYQMPSEERMIYDLRFATAMACVFYEEAILEPLPDANDIQALWEYYRMYYNNDAQKVDALTKYSIFKSC